MTSIRLEAIRQEHHSLNCYRKSRVHYTTQATVHRFLSTVMTKRKRTPSPSPPPRKRIIFEVPLSLWRFQAIARELVRQSELPVQQIKEPKDPNPGDLQRVVPGAPHFDAQTFQNHSLRFSPYSHQSFLPAQPWPQNVKPTSGSSDSNPNVGASAARVMSSSEGAPPQDGHPRQISAGPDDQLFDELNDALHAEAKDNAHDPASQTQFLTGDDRITFDPRLPGDWNGMRQEPYQPFIQNYPPINPQMTIAASQPAFPSTLAHHPPRNSSNSFLPNSTAHPGPATFYNPKPPPPPAPPQNSAQAKPSMPGYYKSSLKLWSQEDRNAAPPPPTLPSSAQATHNFGAMNSPYPHLSYPATPTYPPPQPLASTPVNAFTNYSSTR